MSQPLLWKTLPEADQTSREHLHQLAFFAVSPARHREVGRMGLKPTTRGFGTPEYGGQVSRVEERLLVHEKGEAVATQEMSTIRAAAEFFGGGYEEVWFTDFHDPLDPIDPDTPLQVDPGATTLIGEWFQLAFDVLNRLRSEGSHDDDVSEVQIWPEHFDAACELGSADDGLRASFGASPGDGGIADPYVYVAPWSEIDQGNSYWNATNFGGSILTYSDLAKADSPAAAALDFYRQGYRTLRS